MELELNSRATPFNLDHTLSCGQVFRWEKVGNDWWGIVDENLVRVSQREDKLYCKTFPDEKEEAFVKEYFRLDDDLPYIISLINKDKTIGEALNRLHGLRIVRQDPWECLISYICATFSNISRIRAMIQNLSRKFGREISYDGLTFYTFPKREALAKATLGELLDCRLGFRAKYIREASKMVKDCELDFESLKRLPYREAKGQLLTLPGVGPKVADCILLFSLDKLEAFPVDVWIKRIISKHYSQHFRDIELLKKTGLTIRNYEQINTFGREYFGEYAGYAQEYLFHYYRLHTPSD